MATTVGTVLYKIELDSSSFKSDIKKATKTLKDSTKSGQSDIGKLQNSFNSLGKTVNNVGNKFAGIAKKLKFAGVAAGVGIFAGLTKTITSGISAAQELQSTRISLNSILGDSDAASNLVKELNQLANTTPFLTSEVTKSGKALASFGVDADKIPDTLKRIGDVSSGVNAPLEEIAELYGKAKVQGRLFGEDINQLTGRGIPIIEELAKVLNVSEGEVKSLVASGAVGFPELEKAFESLTDEGGKFNGLTEELSKTFSGRLSTLQSKLKGLASAFVGITAEGDVIEGGLFDRASQGLEKLISLIESPEFANFSNFISGALASALTGVIVVIRTLSSIITGWIDGIRNGNPIIIGITVVLGALIAILTVGAAILAVTSIAMTILTAATAAFGAVMAVITSPILAVIAVISLLVAGIYLLINNWEFVKNKTIEVWNIIVGKIDEAWEFIKDKFNSAINFVISKLAEFGIFVLLKFIEIRENIISAIQGAIDFMLELPGKFFQFGKDLINGFVRGIKAVAGTVIAAIKNTITNALPGFVKSALGINSPSKVFAGFGENIMEGLAVGISNTAKAPQDAIDRATDSLSALSDINASVGINSSVNGFDDNIANQATLINPNQIKNTYLVNTFSSREDARKFVKQLNELVDEDTRRRNPNTPNFGTPQGGTI